MTQYKDFLRQLDDYDRQTFGMAYLDARKLKPRYRWPFHRTTQVLQQQADKDVIEGLKTQDT